MLVSNLGGMHLSNLTFQPFDFPEVLRTAARGFTLPPELPLFCLLSLHANREKRRPLLKTLALLCVFYIGLTFCSEAVLGMKAQLQQQTIHTLSRLGSISVFRRLDALHIAAWMLAELCKVAAARLRRAERLHRCCPIASAEAKPADMLWDCLPCCWPYVRARRLRRCARYSRQVRPCCWHVRWCTAV